MGCCLSKKPKKRQEVSTTAFNPGPAVEAPIDNPKPALEQGKLWLQESPKKAQKMEEEAVPQASPPEAPSKRRQLLKELFREARARQGHEPAKKKKLNIQKMETMDSAYEEKGRSLPALEEAVRQMIENNKEELTSCGICTETYDESRLPMMVCMNQHTYCSQCLSELWKKGHRKFPLDQTPYDIHTVQKNRIVLSILSQLPPK